MDTTLLDYYKASLGNNTLASHNEEKDEINNVTFWFQLYLGSVQMIMNLGIESKDKISSKTYEFNNCILKN